MLKKLSSVIKNPALRSAFKAAIAALLLWSANSHWSLAVLFVATVFYFYFRSGGLRPSYFFSFSVLLLSVLFVNHWSSPLSSLIVSAVFGVLFFLLLSIKNLVFVNRRAIYHFLNNFLFAAGFLNFFLADKSQLFFVKYLLVFGAIFLLFKEATFFEKQYINVGGLAAAFNDKLMAAIFAFVVFQFIWAIVLLPLGFLNASALALVVALTIKDLMMARLSGNLDRQLVLRNITIFIIFSLIIFAASSWQP